MGSMFYMTSASQASRPTLLHALFSKMFVFNQAAAMFFLVVSLYVGEKKPFSRLAMFPWT